MAGELIINLKKSIFYRKKKTITNIEESFCINWGVFVSKNDCVFTRADVVSDWDPT